MEMEILIQMFQDDGELLAINGRFVGRLKGIPPTKFKLTGKERYIRKQLRLGRSKRSLALELKVTWTTLNNFCKKIS